MYGQCELNNLSVLQDLSVQEQFTVFSKFSLLKKKSNMNGISERKQDGKQLWTAVATICQSLGMQLQL